MQYITDERITTTTHHSFYSSSSSILFSLRTLIPCPAKHWANVELFRSLVRSMTRRAHLSTYVVFHLSSISRLDVIRYSTRRNKRKDLDVDFVFQQTRRRKKNEQRERDFSRNNYYANDQRRKRYFSSFRLSIYLIHANDFSLD